MKYLFFLLVSIVFLTSCAKTDTVTPISPKQNDTLNDQWVIVALGDSLTAWFGLPLEESYPSKLAKILEEEWYNYEVINGWVSGDTSQQLRERAELYLDQDPDIALIVIGGNDGLRGLSTDLLKQNILEIIDLYQENDIEIVLGWMDIPINLWLNYRNEFRKIYDEIAKERDIYFLESFLKDVWGVASLNQADRIHPTSEGYDIIVANLYQFLLWNDILTK